MNRQIIYNVRLTDEEIRELTIRHINFATKLYVFLIVAVTVPRRWLHERVSLECRAKK
jgi:hypothetical protein